jgi:hypothetical protein
MVSEQWHGGKGSKPRPTDPKKFADNWDKIFSDKKKNKSKKSEKTT